MWGPKQEKVRNDKVLYLYCSHLDTTTYQYSSTITEYQVLVSITRPRYTQVQENTVTCKFRTDAVSKLLFVLWEHTNDSSDHRSGCIALAMNV